MQEDVRRILKVAAPFAGVALGWYLLMPNFRFMRMSQGEYMSQFLINLRQLQTISRRVHYRLTTPKEVRDWDKCWLNAGWTASELQKEGKWEWTGEGSLDQFRLEQCGSDPSKD